ETIDKLIEHVALLQVHDVLHISAKILVQSNSRITAKKPPSGTYIYRRTDVLKLGTFYAPSCSNTSFNRVITMSFPNNSMAIGNSGPCVWPVAATRIGINNFLPRIPVSFCVALIRFLISSFVNLSR